jgi:hypothetical protein
MTPAGAAAARNTNSAISAKTKARNEVVKTVIRTRLTPKQQFRHRLDTQLVTRFLPSIATIAAIAVLLEHRSGCWQKRRFALFRTN